MLKVKNLEVFFDNGGGTTVQCDGYAYNHDDGKKAADEIKTFLDGDVVDEIESNDDERLECSSQIEENGGYLHMTITQIQNVIKNGATKGWGQNHDDFFKQLGVKIED